MQANNKVVVGIGAVFAAVVVLAITFLVGGASEDPPTQFSAFDADVGSAARPDLGLAIPTANTPRRARSTDEAEQPADDKPPSDPLAAVRGSEDTLNRIGPIGGADDRDRENAPEGTAQDAADDQPRGVVDREDVLAGIKEVKPLVKECYEKALVDFPDAAGRVTVGFRIIAEDGEGRVELSELDEEKTDLFDVKLHDCMLQSIGEARFEAPQSGGVVNVTYPFQLRSDDPATEANE